MTKIPFTMGDFMRHLKPVRTCAFIDMCANYYNEAKAEFIAGASSYEVRGLNTKDGCPWVVFNQ